MSVYKWDGSKWVDIITMQKRDSAGNWSNIEGVYKWDGSKWVQIYSNEITTTATITIRDIGSFQGTSYDSQTGLWSGNWNQAPDDIRQGAYSSTGWYGGIMLLTRPTIGKGVIRVDNYKLTLNKISIGNHGSSNTIKWRGVNKTSLSGDVAPIYSSSPSCDMNISGGTTDLKSTETGSLEKDSAFKEVLKAWLNGTFANIGVYAGTSKPNQTDYLGLKNITLEVTYTYNP